MKHILFHPNPHNLYKIAILIKESAFASSNINKAYVTPLIEKGITPDSIIALSLKYNEQNKAPVKLIKEHLKTVLKGCAKLGIETLVVADSSYFKTLTGLRKAEPHFGYIKPCKFKDFEHINVILSVNYQALFYNPVMQSKLDMSIETVISHTQGTHVNLGANIIHHAEYPSKVANIHLMLKKLHDYPVLSCDIETKSLALADAGIATISFAWSRHEGCAFAVDRGSSDEVKKYLLDFFSTYKGTLMYHGGTFDIKILIYNLFMQEPMDMVGMVDGLQTMYQNIEDTKLITYVATNTTAGNVLGLKENAFEYTGNYAQDDIKDTTLIPLPELLKYNLIDCLATWYVYEKNYPIMIQDNQLDVYTTLLKPSMKVITQMELTGMPMNKHIIDINNISLKHTRNLQLTVLNSSPIIKAFMWQLQREDFIEKNLLLKKKFKPIEEFKKDFNPASNKQVQKLLYQELGFEVVDKTDTGQPAVGKDAIKKLLNQLKSKHSITDEELKYVALTKANSTTNIRS